MVQPLQADIYFGKNEYILANIESYSKSWQHSFTNTTYLDICIHEVYLNHIALKKIYT